MANEVYLLTHDGLSQMVSSRAATRFLDKALEAKGYSPDSVSSEEMREILQGSILRELRQILPKDGVERSIKQIARSLRKQAEKVAEALLAVTNAPASNSNVSNLSPITISGDVLLMDDDDVPPVEPLSTIENAAYSSDADGLGIIHHSSPLEDSQAFDTSEVEAALASLLHDDSPTTPIAALQSTPSRSIGVNGTGVNSIGVNSVGLTDSARVTEVILPQVTSLSETNPANPATLKPDDKPKDLSPESLAKMLVKFAQLDHVKVVAAVRPNGEISMARGSGFDVDALSRLGSLGIKLLSRGRVIRSYYLSHSRYQLFMFPLPSHTLIVVGSSEVNVGEVFNTLSQLEEEV
jgi:hypothetical protein